ncbi:MAG: pyruvate kinase, partial [Rhodobacterales bacterium]|nr:pyruvate kinase [Rhodobacterales bacterium]
AVMLSAETAVGEYPEEAVTMMDRILTRVEADPTYQQLNDAARHLPEATAEDAISAAARQVAETVSAKLIVSFTSTGSTALRAARERPPVRILGLTTNPRTACRLALVWGIYPVTTRELKSFAGMVRESTRVALREGLANPGDRLVITAGVPFGTPGATNILRIAWIE